MKDKTLSVIELAAAGPIRPTREDRTALDEADRFQGLMEDPDA